MGSFWQKHKARQARFGSEFGTVAGHQTLAEVDDLLKIQDFRLSALKSLPQPTAPDADVSVLKTLPNIQAPTLPVLNTKEKTAFLIAGSVTMALAITWAAGWHRDWRRRPGE